MRKMIICCVVAVVMIFPSSITYAQWEYEKVECNGLEYETDTHIKIAVIDSGIVKNDITSEYIAGGYNFVDGNDDYTDILGHGTKVSSILMELSKMTGVNIDILALKAVNDQGESTKEFIVKAVEHAIAQDVDVINISIKSHTDYASLEAAVQKAADNDIVVVAAAGNDDSAIYCYPASYDCVISVGGIEPGGKKSWFSNYNDQIDVMAPADNITTMELDGSYGIHGGTSYAAPFVSFQAGILKKLRPYLSADEIMQVIRETSIDCGDIGRDNYYGYGVIDYMNAMQNCDKALIQYSNWEPMSIDDSDKNFSIELSKGVKSAGSIHITDEFYNELLLDIKINDKTIVVQPKYVYEADTIYSLTVEDTVSSDHETLDEGVRMKFRLNEDMPVEKSLFKSNVEYDDYMTEMPVID
ncbi:Subtilase family protein [Peptoclostridium litorale DSM 5388]|uniref:Minor extracellular protease Epr n=1 Tax=Peptoclostridium litorale DSM 5388 TaxID=1121324 RepID=A0A069REA6_PEPLI|nr:S8 family serine peptidase [Peptoclostridium litorale]KDR95073.1 minor extracellular protease Epr [Peptoclostridium litorale DSM 5388]SIN75460.1 Subtilase family protein [Peptoclostridium litorale DSM 5388]